MWSFSVKVYYTNLCRQRVRVFNPDRSTDFINSQCPVPLSLFVCSPFRNKLRSAQRAMDRKMLDLKLQNKMPCSEIRKRTKIIDIIEYTLKQKWKWAGHIARMKDNRWTKRCTEWQPCRRKRPRGRPSRRWQDNITEGGNHLD